MQIIYHLRNRNLDIQSFLAMETLFCQRTLFCQGLNKYQFSKT
jgi:hypothetical protein